MKKIIGTFLVVLSLFSASLSFAVEGSLGETEIVAALAQQDSFSSETNIRDPFKPLVKKEVKTFIRPEEVIKPKKQDLPVEKMIKPIRLKVSGICGNPDGRLAIIEFEGNEFVVTAGQTVNGAFSIIEVVEDGVIIFAHEQSRRHVFKLA